MIDTFKFQNEQLCYQIILFKALVLLCSFIGNRSISLTLFVRHLHSSVIGMTYLYHGAFALREFADL